MRLSLRDESGMRPYVDRGRRFESESRGVGSVGMFLPFASDILFVLCLCAAPTNIYYRYQSVILVARTVVIAI